MGKVAEQSCAVNLYQAKRLLPVALSPLGPSASQSPTSLLHLYHITSLQYSSRKHHASGSGPRQEGARPDVSLSKVETNTKLQAPSSEEFHRAVVSGMVAILRLIAPTQNALHMHLSIYDCHRAKNIITPSVSALSCVNKSAVRMLACRISNPVHHSTSLLRHGSRVREIKPRALTLDSFPPSSGRAMQSLASPWPAWMSSPHRAAIAGCLMASAKQFLTNQ